MRMPIDVLLERVKHSLVTRGVPLGEAEVGAEMCVDAELRGHKSHGLRLLRNVFVEYEHGSDRRSEITRVRESAVSAQIDGGFHLSWYVHRLAADLVSEKALASGIAIVSVRRAGVSGALGYFAERAAREGLVSMVFCSTPLTVVAPGTTVPTLGTNPIAVGIPRADGDPLVLDMATSSIAFNQVLRLREIGENLPPGVANGSDGSTTEDAADAIDPASGRGRILPFGGHRGYGLALMLELMVSAGVTGRTSDAKRGPVVLEPEDFGAIYLAYRPELLGDPADMRAALEGLVSDLEHMGARVPGEQSRKLRDEARSRGYIDVDTHAMELLHT